MWELDLPIGELLLRAVAAYVILLLMMRVSGRRTVGQFTPFDLLVVMLVSEAAGSSMIGSDESLPGGLLVCAVLIGLNSIVGIVTARVRPVERLLEGEAILLGRNGKVFEGIRKRHRISQNDIEKVLREEDCKMEDMACMFLEPDGSLSVQTR